MPASTTIRAVRHHVTFPKASPHPRMRLVHALAALGVLVLVFQGSLASGTAAAQVAGSDAPVRTFFTGIDPGIGNYYTYAPSVIQTSPTTRNVFDCENYASGVIHDHVYLSVGHLVGGQWEYGPLKDVFGPQDDPNPHGYFSVHACEPEVIGGNFHFGGKPYQWALLFTAESVASNTTNQLGLAFANNLAGPWKPDPTPIVQTADDFGHNRYPYNCPNLYCLGQPAAIDFGPSGHILVTYMSNAGSPGNDTAPREGLVLRELDLSNVPATGPCQHCLATLPNGKSIEAVTTAGLNWPPNDASIAYDAATQSIVIGYDGGPNNTGTDEVPVTPWVTVARISESGLLSGQGTWQVLGAVGSCISGYSLNHNSGIIRRPNGDMPNGNELSLIYTVADHNRHAVWDLFGYRMWDFESPLGSGLTTEAGASANCSGYNVLTSSGQVAGTAKTLGPSRPSSTPAVGMALTPDRQGYDVVSPNGTVSRFGDAAAQPRPSGLPSHTTGVVGLAVDPVTGGYWVADGNGSVYLANAPALGSLARRPHSGSVVAIASTPAGVGYYLVTSTGQVFTFGHAQNFGGLTHAGPRQTITSIAVTPDGLGYYLLSATGSITTYGDAVLYGPSVVPKLNGQADAIAVSPDGLGYVVATTGGQVVPYGDAVGAVDPAIPAGERPVALTFS